MFDRKCFTSLGTVCGGFPRVEPKPCLPDGTESRRYRFPGNFRGFSTGDTDCKRIIVTKSKNVTDTRRLFTAPTRNVCTRIRVAEPKTIPPPPQCGSRGFTTYCANGKTNVFVRPRARSTRWNDDFITLY